MKKPTISRFGERAILIQWDHEVEEAALYQILAVKQVLVEELVESKVEVLTTYNTIFIKYPLRIREFNKVKSQLESIFRSVPKVRQSVARLFTIPVCYDKSLGVDIVEVARLKKMTIEEVVKRHTQPIYTIYFQGFLPGFLYLGGLDKALKVSRKKEPRLHLSKGSVGLAENQTGIYPQDSAGGWQIIGNSPIEFFNAENHPPSPFRAGDKLKFQAISLATHKVIKSEVEKGIYNIQSKYFRE